MSKEIKKGMKNGIIIDGEAYELQDVVLELTDGNNACDVCALEEECEALGKTAMCMILHGAGGTCVYRYIGKEEEK